MGAILSWVNEVDGPLAILSGNPAAVANLPAGNMQTPQIATVARVMQTTANGFPRLQVDLGQQRSGLRVLVVATPPDSNTMALPGAIAAAGTAWNLSLTALNGTDVASIQLGTSPFNRWGYAGTVAAAPGYALQYAAFRVVNALANARLQIGRMWIGAAIEIQANLAGGHATIHQPAAGFSARARARLSGTLHADRGRGFRRVTGTWANLTQAEAASLREMIQAVEGTAGQLFFAPAPAGLTAMESAMFGHWETPPWPRQVTVNTWQASFAFAEDP